MVDHNRRIPVVVGDGRGGILVARSLNLPRKGLTRSSFPLYTVFPFYPLCRLPFQSLLQETKIPEYVNLPQVDLLGPFIGLKFQELELVYV